MLLLRTFSLKAFNKTSEIVKKQKRLKLNKFKDF